ncbi:MAG: ABC transporter permease [Acidobacteriales bacterium]|nr:ABC transporter permease [Terriglobales bacterium]
MMNTLWQDLRYGLRMLLKKPGFTLIAVMTLALGIGANTAIFSVVNGVLMKSLPYHEPERIVLLWGDVPSRNEHRTQVSATDVADWRKQNTVFEEVATFSHWGATLSGEGEPERLSGMQVGDGYFSVMRGQPLLGRVFTPEEQVDGKDYVIVLGYGLWQSRFGGAREVIGKKVYFSARPYTIVGVMPEDFQPLPANLVENRPQFYRPVAEAYDEEERGSRHLRAIARLKPNVSLKQSQSEMNLIAKRLADEHPKSNTGYGVHLVTITEETVGGLRLALILLLLAVMVVLLIACGNVGNLLLARAMARQKEIVIRAALGATRGRLIRQLLTESLLVALLGGGLGLLLALWGTELITSLGKEFIPSLSRVEIELPVLAFTLAVSAGAGILFGLAPAIQLSRPDLNEGLKEGGRVAGGSTAQRRLRNGLIVAEVAMALVLLVSAGLLIRSIIHLRRANPGFNTGNLLTMNVWLPHAKYPDAPKWVAFYDQINERIRALPGVQSAGMTGVLPISHNFDRRSIQVETHPVPRGQEADADTYIVTPGYLQTMQIPLLKGRELTTQDVADVEPVALISETFARRYWPGGDPLGKRIKFPGSAARPQPWRTVVGVVRDVKQYGVDKESTMQLYLPQAQSPVSWLTLAVRTTGNPALMLNAVRDAIRSVDPDQAVFEVATMEGLLAESIAKRRFVMLLLAVFAALALALAAIGIYGVMAYTVAQRTQEIGIRMALGAQTRDVLRLVVGQGMRLALFGVGIGLIAAIGLTRLMTTLLFGVSATDLLTFALIAAVLMFVALLACWVPARRAAKVDPMIALRCE